MLGSGSPASLTVMVMMVMMMLMGEPDPRMSHVGVGFPRRLYKKIFFSYCDRGGGTRPQHDFGRATAFYCVPNCILLCAQSHCYFDLYLAYLEPLQQMLFGELLLRLLPSNAAVCSARSADHSVRSSSVGKFMFGKVEVERRRSRATGKFVLVEAS